MKLRNAVLPFLTAFGLACAAASPASEPIPVKAQAYFSPDEGAEQVLVDNINRAKKSVRVQAYLFTAPPIAEALTAAHNRGVSVEVLVDKKMRTAPKSLASQVAQAGVPLLFDEAHHTAHNKIILIDGDKVITGSYNFAKNIDRKNAENFVILESVPLYNEYLAQWEKHKAHSVP
jgi:phosphatidylserine/phosphatidylglycerophosphate/cardiolipin synthase-like enzyme